MNDAIVFPVPKNTLTSIDYNEVDLQKNPSVTLSLIEDKELITSLLPAETDTSYAGDVSFFDLQKHYIEVVSYIFKK